jgi:hypothetical protein
MLVHDIDHAIAEAPQEEEGANQSKGHKVIAAISGAKERRLVHKKGEMIEAQMLSGFSKLASGFIERMTGFKEGLVRNRLIPPYWGLKRFFAGDTPKSPWRYSRDAT